MNQLDEAQETDRQAVKAAQVAVSLYVEAGKTPTLNFSQVMLREVAHHAPSDTQSGHSNAYVESLKIVSAAIEQSKPGAFEPLPADLSNAILFLARAFKLGAGIAEDLDSYISWLKKAADWGSSEAAFEYAIHCRPTDLQAFSKYIKQATEAGDNMLAYIYKVVGDCCLSDDLMFEEVSKLLVNVLEEVEKIRKEKHTLREGDAVDGIAHYTKPKALKNMLGNQTKKAENLVRLYNTAHANDPKEGKRLTHFKSKETGYVNPLKPFYEEREDGDDSTTSKWQTFSVFLASFSLEPNNLNLWRFYGDDGTGFSIVTPLSAFNTAVDRGAMGGAWANPDESSADGSLPSARASMITLYKVLYTDQEVEETLSSLKPSLKALDDRLMLIDDVDVQDSLRSATVTILSELMYLYKEVDYKEEKEVRTVEARPLGSPSVRQHPDDSASFSRLYLETVAVLFESAGSSILIGPKVQKADAVMLDIRHQLATMEWNQCKVQHSLRPYR